MRYIQFDALRGIAAIAVVLGHYIGLFPVNDTSKLWYYFTNLPIRILWDGAGAVNLFFVLSGFCVALPYVRTNNARPIRWLPFVVRRMFRLYPAYWVALLLCIILKLFYIHPATGDISFWGGEFWQWDSLRTIEWLKLFGLVYGANTHALNPPMWSLVVEMRMAFVLPFIFYIYKRVSVAKQGFITGIMLFIAIINIGEPLLLPINYIGLFLLGTMIASKKDIIELKVNSLSAIELKRIVLAAVLLCISRWPGYMCLQYLLGEEYRYACVNLFNSLNGLGYSLIIVLFFHKKIANMFSNKISIFLGQISYSVYLIHFPIMLICVSYIGNYYVAWIPLFVVALSLSWGIYNTVELPLIKLGKKISDRI